MPDLQSLALPVSALFAVFGAGVVLLLAARSRRSVAEIRQRKRPAVSGKSGPAIEMECHVCQKQLVFHANELVALSGPEVALVSRAQPEVAGRALAEYVCPYYEAAHCFSVDTKTPQWLGVNLYVPQEKSARCGECGKLLRRPAWAAGAFDGRLNEAPDLLPEYGLVCPWCHAVCCVACCTNHTRKRTSDGSLLCPRCSRGPVDAVFHF